MITPYPSLSKAYSILQHDEHQRESSHNSGFSSDSVAFYASSGSSSNGRGYTQRVQFDPKRPLHPSSNDSKRPPPPPWNSSSSSTSTLFCKYCKRSGHLIGNCYGLYGYPKDFKFTKNKSVAASCVQSSEAPPHGFDNAHQTPPRGFTNDQYQHILGLIQKSQISREIDENTALTAFAGPISEEATENW